MKNVFAIFSILIISGCTGNYKTTFDHAAQAEPVNIHVAPILNEEEMDVQVVYADSSAATAQYGLIGALVGSIIDASVNSARERKAERKAAVIRDLTAGLNFSESSQQAALSIGNHEKWDIQQVDSPIATTGWDDLARQAFEGGDSDAVVLLDFEYALTPSLDQVRADVVQRVYFRTKKANSKGIRRASSYRAFSYFSPSHPVDFRVLSDDERADLKAELEEEYENRQLARPEAAEELAVSLAEELQDLEKLKTIPDRVAIREAWESELVTRYVQQSVDHLSFMINHDWAQTVVPEPETRAKDKMMVINTNGLLINDKGQTIAQRDQNSIFRSHYGNMYSAPTPVESTGE